MSTTPVVPADQVLNKEDERALKQVMKLYEGKQMKKALKAVQGILDANPIHGESLAMKGLILSSAPYNKKEEAHKLVKEGLVKNFKSLVCWHVYGLLYRSDANYPEAIKCYKQASRIDDSNLSILRDLSMLQIHSRDIATLTDTRQRLLELKPHNKTNWIGFALAHHLQGNHECAQAILEAYESTMGLPPTPYEVSEFYSYRVQVKLEGQDWKGTLAMMESLKDKLRDREFVLCTKGECYENLKQFDKAVECYAELVDNNSESKEFLDAYVTAKKDGDKTCTDFSVYKELREKYPKSQAIEKYQADYSSGDDFKALIKQFIKRYILKCIPSLSSAVKSYYQSEEKAQIIFQVLSEFKKEFDKKQTIDGTPANKNIKFWILLAFGAHFFRTKKFETALDYVEQARKHTPTIEIVYAHKARVLKKLGRFEEAAAEIETARKMDLADRYFNNKTAKYQMRAGKWLEAEETFTLFTYAKQHETWSTILEMQCMWYELELADCFYRKGDVEAALSRYLLVDRHFHDIVEDQLDFHHYLSKKNNVRAYINMLRYMDTARSHHFFCRAARNIVRCYLDIHTAGKEEIEKGKLPELADYVANRESLLTKEQKEKEEDYIMTIEWEKPLPTAEKFIKELLKYRAQELPTQTLAVELYTTMNLPIKALQNIKQAFTIDGASKCMSFKKQVLAFFAAQDKAELHPLVKATVEEVKAEVLPKFK